MTKESHTISSIDNCRLIELDRHHHENGNLTVVEGCNQLPYELNRAYYLYDIPGGEERGGHSHRECAEFLVAISGSFDVTIDDGINQRVVSLNRPYRGLLIEPGIWRVLHNFSSGAVCLVLSSHHFSEQDYVRNYDEFIELTAIKREK